VSSIGGEWRYVDCIAKNAGKGRAMVYLASKFGVSLEDVVAAGDSGNDLLMLGRLPEGCHPAIIMSNSHPEVSERKGGGGQWSGAPAVDCMAAVAVVCLNGLHNICNA
jgi:sucrose-phosphate synthase